LVARSFADSIRIMKDSLIDLVITNFRLPDASGIDLITHVKRERPNAEVLLTATYVSLNMSIEAIKAGACYYLEKPYTPDRLLPLVDRALQVAALTEENQTLKSTLGGDTDTFGIV